VVRVGFKTFCHQVDWPALEATWSLGGQLDVFESAWLNDHLGDFSFERGGPAFEALTLLAALARHVPGKWIGHLALSNTFRHPAIVARAALTSPPPIGKETGALASRMGPQGLEPALRQFAKEIADPVGDHVAMALIVRARHGGIGLAEVLSALSLDVDEQVRMRRAILSEQTKQVGNIRMILGVTVLVWVLLAIFARSYMAPYNTVAGQVALGVIVAGFALTLGWLRRLSRPVVGARFLQDLVDLPGTAPQLPPTGQVVAR